VLFGDHAPSGRLPVTVPVSVDQLPPFEDYSMQGRTYRYADWEPLYPFGFGLSYTTFAYSDLKLNRNTPNAGESLELRFNLLNTSSMEGDEVVQVYLSDLEASAPVPLHKLVDFRRVHLTPGEHQEVVFEIPAEAMTMVDEEGKRILEPGYFRVTVGGCSPSARGEALGAPKPVSAVFEVM
jgi:beta-glucosidase